MFIVGDLQIEHSLESDEGKYECVAENRHGVAYSYGANLYVRGELYHLLHCDILILVFRIRLTDLFLRTFTNFYFFLELF